MEPLVEDAIRGMLEGLDPHSVYLDREEMRSESEVFDGEFSGIGIEYNILNDSIIVINTVAKGPAETVGLQPNDRIVEVDGRNVVGVKRSEVPSLLRGPRGSVVGIGVARRGAPGHAALRHHARQHTAQHGGCGLPRQRRHRLHQGHAFRAQHHARVPRGIRGAGRRQVAHTRPQQQRRRHARPRHRDGRLLPARGRRGRFDRGTSRPRRNDTWQTREASSAATSWCS